MSELMLQEHRPVEKAFSTVGTNIALRGELTQLLAEALLTLRHFQGLSWGVSSALRSTWMRIAPKGEPGGAELRRLGGRVCYETVCIFVGVFSDMNPLVLHEDALVIEALATDQTLVRFGPRWRGQQGRIPKS